MRSAMSRRVKPSGKTMWRILGRGAATGGGGGGGGLSVRVSALSTPKARAPSPQASAATAVIRRAQIRPREGQPCQVAREQYGRRARVVGPAGLRRPGEDRGEPLVERLHRHRGRRAQLLDEAVCLEDLSAALTG
jgi:hypothetical protein